MAELFNIHMPSDLSEWTSTQTDSGDLSQAAGAGLGGTSGGMSVLLDDTNAIYAQKTVTTNTSGTLRVRFYIDPNSLTFSADGSHYVFEARTSGNVYVVYGVLGYVSSNYYLRLYAYNDAGSTYGNNTSATYITDEPHYVEFLLTKSSGNNGTFQFWIDGVSKYSTAALDNDTRFADFSYVRLGASSGIDATTTGAYYLDEIAANDDGSEIGPITSTPTVTPAEATQSQTSDAATLLTVDVLTAGEATQSQASDEATVSFTPQGGGAVTIDGGEATQAQASDAASVTLDKQYLFPSVDVSAGDWTTAPLSPKVDDWNDISDYITLANNATGTCTLGTLIRTMDGGAIADPLVSTGHSLKWYSRRSSTNRSTTLRYDLMQGAGTIASGTVTYSSGSAWAAGTLDLSAAQADSITNYADLRVQIACTATGSGNAPQVAAVWFEFPLYVAVTQWTITPGESTQGQTSDAATTITTQIVSAAESTQTQTSDIAPVTGRWSVSPAECAQAQSSDAATIKPIDVASAGEATQSQTSDAATLNTVTLLTAGESVQVQTSDAASLTYGSQATVDPAESTQSQVSDGAGVTPVYLLTAGEAAQSQASDAATVSFSGISAVTISAAESAQAQTSEGATLIPVYKLTAGETLQAQSSDAASLNFTAPSWVVTPAEASQGQTSDAVTLAVVYLLTVGEATQAQLSDAATVTLGDLFLHGHRRLYRMSARTTHEVGSRKTNRVATRQTVEVDDE